MRHYLFAVLYLFAGSAFAACGGASPTWNCAAGSTNAEVQAAVNAAKEFDTINLAAGAYTWSGGVSVPDKSLVISGAGVDVTKIILIAPAPGAAAGTFNTSFWALNFTSSAHAQKFRLSGMTMVGTMDCGSSNCSSALYVSAYTAPAAVKGWRLDHLRLNLAGHTGIRGITVVGVTYGLIDHFTWSGGGYIGVSSYGYSSSDPADNQGKAYYSHPTNWGSDEAVYIEDSLYDLDGNWPGIANDVWFGGAQVWRHNVMNRTGFQSHGAGHSQGARGGMKQEIYANDIDAKNPNLFATYRPAQFRSGTQLIFNNRVRNFQTLQWHQDYERAANAGACGIVSSTWGKCDGTQSADGNVDPKGWPCLDQPGRGSSGTGTANAAGQTSEPVWSWKNGSQDTCITGGVCDNSSTIGLNTGCAYPAQFISATAHANGQVDFVNGGNTPKPGYTPYTYPHPLQAGGGESTIPPPAGCSVQDAKIVALTGQLAACVTQAGNLAAQVATLQAAAVAAGGQITALQNQLSTALATAVALQAKIDAAKAALQ